MTAVGEAPTPLSSRLTRQKFTFILATQATGHRAKINFFPDDETSPTSTTIREMPKRKNPFPTASASKKARAPVSLSLSDPSSLPPRAVDAVHRAVVAEVKKGSRNVFRALKKAQTFETRKVIKRVKQAR
jgi:hypothetical protein